MKRAILLLLMAVCVCGLAGCEKGSVSKVEIDYGDSVVYSKEDMDSAIKLIVDEFSTWEGCELHTITYSSDDGCDAEDLAWLNGMGNKDGREGDYTQGIMFESSFHTPKTWEGLWSPDMEYTDWQWWLARTDGGEWHLLSWGYA